MHHLAIDLNWPILIIVGLGILALLAIIMRRNQKDKKDLEQTITHIEEEPTTHSQDDEAKV